MKIHTLRNIIIALLTVMIAQYSFSQSRTDIHIPDIPGYKTLKADLHTHTVFSDGRVWPDIRVQEAWHDGLDVIAITDHINYKGPIIAKYVKFEDENAGYNEAEVIAERMGITLIKGLEFNSPNNGHYNMLFLSDVNKAKPVKGNYIQSFKNAKAQGAFIQWNHPLEGQWKNPKWGEFQEQLLNAGLLDGIEIFNNKTLHAASMPWVKEKKLTISCGSDIHYLSNIMHDEVHRPITLIFAKENTAASIKEALFEHRTAAYFADTIIGAENHLQQLFTGAVKTQKLPIITFRKGCYVELSNDSDIPFNLELVETVKGLKMPQKIKLASNKTTLLEASVYNNEVIDSKQVKVKYRVKNFRTLSNEPIVVELILNEDKQSVVERKALTNSNSEEAGE